MTGGEIAQGFFMAWLALPIVILFYIIGFAWKRTRPHRAMEIDLDVSSLASPVQSFLRQKLTLSFHAPFRPDENRS